MSGKNTDSQDRLGPKISVLLSAIPSNVDASNHKTGLKKICDTPLLQIQARQLKQAGISQILIEVDHIGGELTLLADDMKNEGVEIVFIRSVTALKQSLGDNEYLLFLREGAFLSSEVISQLLKAEYAQVLTLHADDHDDNFERIDLNHRWSGIAMLDCNSIKMMDELPDGYSLPSALLRSGVQSQSKFDDVTILIKQNQFFTAFDDSSLAALERQMIFENRSEEFSWPERYLFHGPISFLNGKMGDLFQYAHFVWMAIAALATILIMFGYPAAGFSISAVASFAIYIKSARQGIVEQQKNQQYVTHTIGILLVLLLMNSWQLHGVAGFFPVIVFVALFASGQLSSALPQMRWFLLSPLFVIFIFAIANIFGVFLLILQGYILILALLTLAESYLKFKTN